MKIKKPRKQHEPRDLMTLGMILTCKGGPHRLKSEKRAAQKRRRQDADW